MIAVANRFLAESVTSRVPLPENNRGVTRNGGIRESLAVSGLHVDDCEGVMVRSLHSCGESDLDRALGDDLMESIGRAEQ